MKKDIWAQYPSICHYTKFDTVFKIINSRCLWATHFSHLNDTSEFYYSIDIIANALFMKLQNQGNFSATLTEVKLFVRETLFPPVEPGLYVASFCKVNNMRENDGILSMWRSYGKEGCYIEFDAKHINEHFDESVGRNFDEVIYDGIDDSQNECELLADEISSKIKESLILKTKPSLLEQFFRLVTMLKHPGFHEEKEVRLAILNSLLDGKGSFEVKQNELGRNYISLPFNPRAIKRIIVGPSKAQKFKMDKIKEHLDSVEDYNHVIVDFSTIPYRDWH